MKKLKGGWVKKDDHYFLKLGRLRCDKEGNLL